MFYSHLGKDLFFHVSLQNYHYSWESNTKKNKNGHPLSPES